MINLIKYQDSINLKQYLNQKYQIKNFDDTNLLFIDSDTNIAEINLLIDQNSLFNQYEKILFYNPTFISDKKAFNQAIAINFFEYLNELKVFDNIIIVTDETVLSHKDFKILTAKWTIEELKIINDKQKQQLLNQILNEQQLQLSKPVYATLLNNLDYQYGNMVQEVKKLKILSLTKTNDEQMLDLIANFNQEKIFSLIDNLLLHQNKIAWKIYLDLVNHHEDEIAMINAISSQLFNIYYVIRLLQNGSSIAKITELTKIPVFVINLIKTKFINYNINKISMIIEALLKLEKDIKLSQTDKTLAFKNFLINI